MILLIISLFILSTHAVQLDLAADQLLCYKVKSLCPMSSLTTSAGAPVGKSEAIDTLDYTSLINNEYFFDTSTHFVRERTPERLVHSKGAGAFGYFEVTRNITSICKAKLFSSIGKRTKIAVRFSVVFNEKGISDTVRGTRGFAVKFYTEDGNFDIVSLSTPMFIFKDPLLFMMFKHSGTKNPKTNLADANAAWDNVLQNPDTLFSTFYNFGDRGIPYNFRHMPGFSVHTYQIVNKNGLSSFVRFHFIPDLGIKNLFTEEAKKIGDKDPDSFNRDLYNSIENGNFPTWTVSLQILSFEDIKNASFDVFDLTRILPEEDYPLTPIGQFVLNENVLNNYAEVEQAAFCPSNLVPGILGAPDKIFETRRLSYRNAQYYRIGANFNKIRINRPLDKVSTYLRDGKGPGSNGKDSPNYYPNSFCGPVAEDTEIEPKPLTIIEKKPYNFDQASKLVKDMSIDEQNRLVKNFVASLEEVNRSLQDQAIELITKVNSNVGKKISKAIYAERNK